MRKFLTLVALSLFTILAQAEASFDQIEMLIQQKNYAAAESGLEGIIQNHPKSAKAFYAMAQAQAGLGNLEKAQKALNIATGLNPTLDFAPEGSVRKLKEAITPQQAKIEAVEETHYMRNFMILLTFIVVGFAGWFGYKEVKRKQEEEEAELSEKLMRQAQAHEAEIARQLREQAKQDEAIKAEEALKAHKNYNHERFDPANPDKLKSVAQFKREQSEAAEKQRLFFEAEARREAQARSYSEQVRMNVSNASPAPSHTTVVNNSSSGSDLLTGVILGNMMGSHHDTTRVVEREVIREVPAPKRDTSWDDTPSRSSSRDSSWDETPSSSSSRSSSWDSGSSSSSSSSSWSSSSSSDSSWSSSSSDSGSSSSWD